MERSEHWLFVHGRQPPKRPSPYDEGILRCLSCNRYTSKLEAAQRLFLTGRCGHCRGGELVEGGKHRVIQHVNEVRWDAARIWERIAWLAKTPGSEARATLVARARLTEDAKRKDTP